MNETMNEEIALIQIKGLLTILGYVDQTEEQLKILALGITELDLLRKLQKEHAKTKRALEIIKEKGVNIYLLNETDNVEEYNKLIKSHYGMKQLTQEEYDILKEVLL